MPEAFRTSSGPGIVCPHASGPDVEDSLKKKKVFQGLGEAFCSAFMSTPHLVAQKQKKWGGQKKCV